MVDPMPGVGVDMKKNSRKTPPMRIKTRVSMSMNRAPIIFFEMVGRELDAAGAVGELNGGVMGAVGEFNGGVTGPVDVFWPDATVKVSV